MIDINSFEQVCPECQGCGRLTNNSQEEYLSTNINLEGYFRGIELAEHYESAKQAIEHEAPENPISPLCKRCHGGGKVLTDEGARLMKFIRSWLNPNC